MVARSSVPQSEYPAHADANFLVDDSGIDIATARWCQRADVSWADFAATPSASFSLNSASLRMGGDILEKWRDVVWTKARAALK